MSTVTKTIDGWKTALFGGRMCGECGWVKDAAGPAECPRCRANARLAEALHAIRAEDDYDAVNAAADALQALLLDAPVWRQTSWTGRPLPAFEVRAVKKVRDPVLPRDDDDFAAWDEATEIEF